MAARLRVSAPPEPLPSRRPHNGRNMAKPDTLDWWPSPGSHWKARVLVRRKKSRLRRKRYPEPDSRLTAPRCQSRTPPPPPRTDQLAALVELGPAPTQDRQRNFRPRPPRCTAGVGSRQAITSALSRRRGAGGGVGLHPPGRAFRFGLVFVLDSG